MDGISHRHISNINVKKTEHLDSLYPELVETDILINNVGIAYDGILATQGVGNIQEILNVNLFSVLYLTKLYLRARLSKRRAGNIISISSIIASRGFSGLAVYSATKGALNSMTLSLAREMGPKGFRVNAVLPGYFESDLSKSLSQEKRSQIIRRTPLGRLATTDDICPVVEFLASDKSKFVTGQLLVVDGGLTV
jgi:3-oxoacyl-[acyl-carrier protein] reductase